MNRDHQVTWKPTRPEFSINCVRATSRNCYHESWYEIISRIVLDADDLARLDACGLLGMGQAYYLETTDTITDTVPAVTIDKRTGAVVDVPPVNWQGTPITNTHEYVYNRYTVRRICDSGD